MWSQRLKVGQNTCAQRRLAYYPYQNTGKGKGGGGELLALEEYQGVITGNFVKTTQILALS